MANKEIKVLRVLWDDSYRHPDISEKLYEKLYNVTVSSMHQFNGQWYADENKVVPYSFNAEISISIISWDISKQIFSFIFNITCSLIKYVNK